MKKTILFLSLILSTLQLFAQKEWFSLYTDSSKLVNDASKITADFKKDLEKIEPSINFSIKSVLNTTPYLIYYDDRNFTANLPIWEQIIPPMKSFFYEVAGSEVEGKKVFGLFFNGFYLPHELGHAFQDVINNGPAELSYQNEYLANTIAILWWKKHKRNKELKICYEYAKKMWSNLPNPVPSNISEEEYFTKNYAKATQNPYVYGYMQFKQFIQIYEDKSLPDFDTFVKKYLEEKKK